MKKQAKTAFNLIDVIISNFNFSTLTNEMKINRDSFPLFDSGIELNDFQSRTEIFVLELATTPKLFE